VSQQVFADKKYRKPGIYQKAQPEQNPGKKPGEWF
jgi:hypothetical protein